MLGVTDLRRGRPSRRLPEGVRRGDRRRRHLRQDPCRCFLGAAGNTVPDPFFGGEGPDRTGCPRCGRCMVGCPLGAKNTLQKNYLWFAERRARRSCRSAPWSTSARSIRATARRLQSHRALGFARSGRHWCRRPAAWSWRRARWARTGCWPRAGSTARCRSSHRLGELVRTNSRGDPGRHAARGRARRHAPVAITGSIYPDPDTHIETVVYGEAGDASPGCSRC